MTPSTDPVRVGVSACLLGEAVRYDGGHRRDPFLAEMLGRFVEWVPVCPEVESGFGTPREPMQLVRSSHGIRLVTVNTANDMTAPLERLARDRVDELARLGLSGFVLKQNSPSCGLHGVKVFDESGDAVAAGRGLFAARLTDVLPELPVEEEGKLADPRLREHFVERVFAYARVQRLSTGRWTPAAIVRFHAAHKLQLMAHSPAAYRDLGRLVADVASASRPAFAAQYTREFMAALAVPATPPRHVNVLQHMAGYLAGRLDAGSRDELQSAIASYRRGAVPLAVPITLLRHHVITHGISYLAEQSYLEPYPEALALRHQV